MEKTKQIPKKLLFAVGLFWFGQYVFMPFFSPQLEAVGITASAIGTIVGTYGFTQLLLRIPFGFTADKLKNHKIFMLLGFLALALAGTTLFFAESALVYGIARFLAGVSASTWVSFTVFSSGLVAEDNSGRAISMVMTANNLGRFVSFVVGMLLFDLVGMKVLYLISIAAGVIGFVLLLSVQEPQTFSREPMELKDIPKVLKNRGLLLHSLLAALAQLVTFATAQSFTANYAKELGATGTQLGLLSILLGVGNIIGSYWVGTKSSQKLAHGARIAVGFVLLGLYCVLVPTSGSILMLLLVQLVGGLGSAVVATSTMSLSSQTIPKHMRTTAMGAYQSIYSLGMTVGPMLMGFLLDNTGRYSFAFWVMAGFSLVGVVWSFVSGNR